MRSETPASENDPQDGQTARERRFATATAALVRRVAIKLVHPSRFPRSKCEIAFRSETAREAQRS